MIRKLAKGSDADDFRNEVYFEDLSNEYHKRSDVYLQELMRQLSQLIPLSHQMQLPDDSQSVTFNHTNGLHKIVKFYSMHCPFHKIVQSVMLLFALQEKVFQEHM